MEAGMRKLFESPYHDEFANGDKEISIDDARRAVFFPRPSDMKRYAAAFRRVTPEPTARRAKLLKFKLMSVFYTLHRKDGVLMDHFIHYGGLAGLAELLGEDNRVIQSEVVELLIELISPLIITSAATSPRQAHLHHQVYLCLTSPCFWRNVGQILAEPYEVFPKSHASCVRILAGAVGWLRPEVVPSEGDDDILVGPKSSPLDIGTSLNALQQFVSCDAFRAAVPEVQGLAHDLLPEMARGVACRPNPLSGESLSTARASIFAGESCAREDAAHAWQFFRALGNEAFKAGMIWPAEAAYRFALQEGGSQVQAVEASVIDSNRALTLLRAGHPAEAAASASSALERDPRNAKAAYRHAFALLELVAAQRDGDHAKIACVARDALSAAEVAARLEPRDTKVAELLDRARRQSEELASVPVNMLGEMD
eukprot:TRINITY_DN14364_c0_g2_i1.p1 TRINITY_DN14364_c0_g2~~TRINITY_DN14364_c0_g2_i1.p1  ORF type:complete len:486 (-),score=59.08 TRINITY_DN14364_c0_g2_i1:108-1385(-)